MQAAKNLKLLLAWNCPVSAFPPPAVPGGVGGGGAEEAEREYARKGGVMVVLDDGLGSTMPWSVLQGESLQSLQGDGVSEAGAAGGSLGATSATSAAGVTCTQSGEACGRGLEAVGGRTARPLAAQKHFP